MQRKQLRAQTDRVLFNGHDLSAFVSCKVSRPIMPPVNVTLESIGGRDGELFKAAHFGGYDLPVDVWLRSDERRDAATVRHALAKMLCTDEPAPFYYGRKRRVEVSAGTFTINAGGDRPAHLQITAKPASSAAWYLRNVDTGEQVKLASSVTSASTVRVDMATEHATVNGNTAAVTLDSDFFTIDGRTKLQLSSGTAVLEWWERWL